VITYDLSIDNATWTTPQHCAPGSVALSTAVEARWPILLNREGAYGCYNRRETAGGGKSIHGDGRAIDIGIGWQPSAAQKTALHECTEFLAANARHLGVQRIIYNNRAWKASAGWYAYVDGKHFDHAHVEQTMEASWSNPLPLDQAMAVINPPIVLPPEPRPDPGPPPPPTGDDPLLTRYQCTDRDAAFFGFTTARHVPTMVEWADGETDAQYASLYDRREDVPASAMRGVTFVGDLDALNDAETRGEWTAADFRAVVPTAA
jgi:hypothetical protein